MTSTIAELAERTQSAIDSLAIQAGERTNPPYTYAEVVSFDYAAGTAVVTPNGDTNNITVRLGTILPTATGQTVRVEGQRGDRYISEVLGVATIGGATPNAGTLTAPTLTAEAGVAAISASWTEVIGAFTYELQIATDAGFTTSLQTYVLSQGNLAHIILGVSAQNLYFLRVRARATGGGGGPYSATVSVTPLGGATSTSDGSAPTSSPAATVKGGIGYVSASWTEITNADNVTYEVHSSSVSGFTPSATTKNGETQGTSFFLSEFGDGTAFAYGQNIFVRLIAKDVDGSASAGAQGFAQMRQVDTGDAGQVSIYDWSDGNAPAASPTPTVTSGMGYFYLDWTHVTNADPVSYELHLSTFNGFTPATNTLVNETPSAFGFIREQAAAQGGGELIHGQDYYIRITAKDSDGSASPGTQVGPVRILQVLATDVAPLSIGSAAIADAAILSAKIADLAVDSAKIADLAVTNAKIATLAVSQANIQDLAVGTAQIADAAIQTAKIGDLEVTNAKINDLTVSKLTSGVITSTVMQLNGINSQMFSTNYVAGSSGFLIRGDGYAEFFNVKVRGEVTATSGSISGSLVTAGLSADVITAGTINGSAVNVTNLDASNINTGTLNGNNVNVTNLDASNITSGTLSADLINGGTISGTTVNVTNLNATNITTGTASGGIINGGTFGTVNGGNLTNLNASSITTGTMTADRIFGGTINGNNVNVINLNASNITTGTLSGNIINGGTINGTNINGTTINSAFSINFSGGSSIFGVSGAAGTNSNWHVGGDIYANGIIRTASIFRSNGTTGIFQAGGNQAGGFTATGLFTNLPTAGSANLGDAGFGTIGAFTSRAELKENVALLDGNDAVARIRALTPVSFTWKQDAIGDGTNEMVAFDVNHGLLAEEVDGVSPILATHGWPEIMSPADAHLAKLEEAVPTGWNTQAVVANLIAALQNAFDRIDELEKELSLL